MAAQTAVLVGASVAGATAAAALRAADPDIRIVLVGDEARVPYERPPLSKGYLAGKEDLGSFDVHDAGWYEANGVELLLGRRATELDRAARVVRLDDGTELPYDRALLATGSEPRRLPVPGGDLPGVLALRRLEDADAVRAAIDAGGPLVVVGAGWIGLEVSAVARSAGLDVTVLERDPVPLGRVVGPRVGRWFERLHRDAGVDLRLGSRIARVVGDGRAEGVQLEDGTVLPAAAVLAGVGIVPRTELAERAGLAVDDGIRVDGALRTSDPQVWAAGDVARADDAWVGHPLRVEHYAQASDQGPFAGRSMAGALEPGEVWGRPPFFWSDQYDAGLEFRGWVDDASSAPLVVRGSLEQRPFVACWLDGAGRVAAAMHVDAWDDADAVKALVVDRALVDPEALADPGTPWDAVRRSPAA